MDLLIALIPITIIIGMAAVSMDDMSYRAQSVIQLSSLDRVATDSADALAVSSGTPNDWEYTGNPEVPGLAKLDIETNESENSVLSFLKINSLTKSDLEKLVGPKYDACLVFTDSNSNVLKKIGEINNNTPDISRVERSAKTTKLELATSLDGVLKNINSPRTYTTEFPTTQKVRTYLNYWVLVKRGGDYNASIYVNDEPFMNSSEILEGVTAKQINDTLLVNYEDSGNNIVKVVGTSGNGFLDVYVVAAPKNVNENEIKLEDVNPIVIKMELYVWAR